jgi:hypothetical protein
MKWITRQRPKTDRIACPWLIRRFIDPEAEFLFVPNDQVLAVAEQTGGRSFDAEGADYTHSDHDGAEWCTFETLIARFSLGGDEALARLARIVHAADVSRDLDTDPAGAGLLAIGMGGLEVEADDHRLLERASFVYDALYAWCGLAVSG